MIIPYAIDFVIKARNRFPSTGWWGTWTDGKLVHEGRPIGLGQAIMRLTGGVTSGGSCRYDRARGARGAAAVALTALY